jgi:hypothetical protein
MANRMLLYMLVFIIAGEIIVLASLFDIVHLLADVAPID